MKEVCFLGQGQSIFWPARTPEAARPLPRAWLLRPLVDEPASPHVGPGSQFEFFLGFCAEAGESYWSWASSEESSESINRSKFEDGRRADGLAATAPKRMWSC